MGAWKLHLLELSGSKSSRTTSLQNFRVWKVGKNKYLQGRRRNSVREKCGKWQNWEILPYLKIPKKISDRFSLKNVYVSVLVFSVNSKNLNIGCTARFGEIKQEKIVIATSGEKTIAHACSGKTPGSSVRALQLVSTCCLRVQTFGTKSQLCKAFKAVRERQPLDNTFFLVIKPKHNLAAVSTPLKPTWNTRKFFREPPFYFCARGISSAGSRDFAHA